MLDYKLVRDEQAKCWDVMLEGYYVLTLFDHGGFNRIARVPKRLGVQLNTEGVIAETGKDSLAD